MEASELSLILDQHLLWYQTNGVQGEPANLMGVDLGGANLIGANLMNASLYGAALSGANLEDADLTGAKDLPDISWIIPGCLVQLNQISCSFI